jgi:hypothetical protein
MTLFIYILSVNRESVDIAKMEMIAISFLETLNLFEMKKCDERVL